MSIDTSDCGMLKWPRPIGSTFTDNMFLPRVESESLVNTAQAGRVEMGEFYWQ